MTAQVLPLRARQFLHNCTCCGTHFTSPVAAQLLCAECEWWVPIIRHIAIEMRAAGVRRHWRYR
jgi:hypothetical protein